MVKEGERTFLECLDQLEVARAKLEDVRIQTCFTTSLTSFYNWYDWFYNWYDWFYNWFLHVVHPGPED